MANAETIVVLSDKNFKNLDLLLQFWHELFIWKWTGKIKKRIILEMLEYYVVHFNSKLQV
jgi:hypothetical protein